MHLVVVTPRSLSEEQRRLFQELAGSLGDELPKDGHYDKGLFGKIKDAFGGDQ